MAKFYELDLNTFSMESVLAKRCIKKKTMEGIGDVLIELSPFKSAFPNLFKLIQISLSVPPSVKGASQR